MDSVRDLRNRQWYWIDNRLNEDFADALGPHGIALYSALCLIDDGSGSFETDLVRLRDLSGLGWSEVPRVLERLEALDLIRVERLDGHRGRFELLELPEKGERQ